MGFEQSTVRICILAACFLLSLLLYADSERWQQKEQYQDLHLGCLLLAVTVTICRQQVLATERTVSGSASWLPASCCHCYYMQTVSAGNRKNSIRICILAACFLLSLLLYADSERWQQKEQYQDLYLGCLLLAVTVTIRRQQVLATERTVSGSASWLPASCCHCYYTQTVNAGNRKNIVMIFLCSLQQTTVSADLNFKFRSAETARH